MLNLSSCSQEEGRYLKQEEPAEFAMAAGSKGLALSLAPEIAHRRHGDRYILVDTFDRSNTYLASKADRTIVGHMGSIQTKVAGAQEEQVEGTEGPAVTEDSILGCNCTNLLTPDTDTVGLKSFRTVTEAVAFVGIVGGTEASLHPESPTS